MTSFGPRVEEKKRGDDYSLHDLYSYQEEEERTGTSGLKKEERGGGAGIDAGRGREKEAVSLLS